MTRTRSEKGGGRTRRKKRTSVVKRHVVFISLHEKIHFYFPFFSRNPCCVNMLCARTMPLWAFNVRVWARAREAANEDSSDGGGEWNIRTSWNWRKSSLERQQQRQQQAVWRCRISLWRRICIVGRFNIKALVRLRIYYKVYLQAIQRNARTHSTS